MMAAHGRESLMEATSVKKRLTAALCRWLLGKSEKSHFDAGQVRTMLILRNDRIGDMVVTTPLLRELKKSYPRLQIDVLVSSANVDIISRNPHVNEVIIWDKAGFRDGLNKLLAIRRRRYDVIVFPQYVFTLPVALKVKLMRATFLSAFRIAKYGTSTASLGMYDRTVEAPRDRHIVHNFFDLVGNFGLRDIDYRYELFGVDQYAGAALAFCAGLRMRYDSLVCFNYQGSSPSRTLHDDDIVELCRRLASAYPQQAVIITHPPGGRAHAATLVERVARENVVLSFETGSILQLAALVRACDIVLSPDSALVHLASAYNKKILGFYINSDNYRWFYPASEHYRVILAPTLQIGRIDLAETLAAYAELVAPDDNALAKRA